MAMDVSAAVTPAASARCGANARRVKRAPSLPRPYGARNDEYLTSFVIPAQAGTQGARIKSGMTREGELTKKAASHQGTRPFLRVPLSAQRVSFL